MILWLFLYINHTDLDDLADEASSPNYTKVCWFIMIWFSLHIMLYRKEIKMNSKMVDYKDSPYELDAQRGGHSKWFGKHIKKLEGRNKEF